MSELYLLRHAKAVPQEAGGSDRDRPLEQRGRHAAQAVARWIEEQRISPDLVLCSPSLRTRQTLDIVAPAFARPPEIRIEGDIYLAGARELLDRLRELPETVGRLMIVGHNPGFHEFTVYLSDVATGPLIARLAGFPTGALARFAIETGWPALARHHARLTAVVLPKELMRGMG
jgi:phosphohistidine phosphatase